MSFLLRSSDLPYDISRSHVECLAERKTCNVLLHHARPRILSLAIQPNLINMTNRSKRVERVGRWYDGSVASAGAACFSHPIDLLKVHLQERT